MQKTRYHDKRDQSDIDQTGRCQNTNTYIGTTNTNSQNQKDARKRIHYRARLTQAHTDNKFNCKNLRVVQGHSQKFTTISHTKKITPKKSQTLNSV